jgi:hypothetical protein
LNSPFLIGIDLGTTNTAAAYVDTGQPAPAIQIFRVPQLVAPGEVATAPTLPSFLYLPSAADLDAGRVRLPWNGRPDAVVGIFARDQGALAPGRQIASAKSWLSNPAVDRTADILPWGSDDVDRALSPVEVSARVLAHLRDAWNHTMAAGAERLRFEHQAVVLTVPASFDQEARELTVQAARGAGLERLTLLEEPLAAFYAWIAAHRRTLAQQLHDGELVLICDVGGGTTDFSLVEVRVEAGELRFERVAIGEHLLLGGDNLDVALAAALERALGAGGRDVRLTALQRQALRRQCSVAKERLLTERDLERVRITILGSGRAVVGGALTAELTREEVVRSLTEGFLPLTAAKDLPARDRRPGLRELGLPYESEPAITKHLAAFLARSGQSRVPPTPQVPSAPSSPVLIRPDAILFNGGFFTPALARERVADVVARWFQPAADGEGWRPRILASANPEAAVAVGAAYYAALRARPEGDRVLVTAGSPRAYYIGVLGEPAAPGATQTICVMPRGTEEGTRLEVMDRDFRVMTNQPVALTLYSSATRADARGTLVAFPADDPGMHRHAPLITVLRYGKKSRRIELDVRLSVHFTEVGTLELWCESRTSEHRWRLQFQLRGSTPDEGPALPDTGETRPAAADESVIPAGTLAAGEQALREVFSAGRVDDGATEALVARLEALFGFGRQAWPLAAIRQLGDVLLELADGRRKGPRFEARWLNLTGYCLRPGFGAALDPWRIGEARKMYVSGLAYPQDVQCQAEWLVFWQRVAGGLNAGQQREIAQRLSAQIGVGGRKPPKRPNPQIEREGWRLLASLERLEATARARLGDELINRIRKEPRNVSLLWALGRVGARAPFYGPLNTVVPPAAVEPWIDRLLALRALAPDALWTVAQLAALTGDAARDVGDEVRARAVARLRAEGASEELVGRLIEPVVSVAGDTMRIFGESLPEGLRLAPPETGARGA